MSYYVDVLYDTNKKSYVLIVVGSEPCPYMARISHDPPRSNYVVVLKIEDKSHACGRSSIKVRAAYQQLLLHSYIYIYIQQIDIRCPICQILSTHYVRIV